MAKVEKHRSKAAQALQRQLARYRSMRDFNVTSEPQGKKTARQSTSKNDSLPFVVQKHAATRLHYDFRLAWNGVLKSWAVTKGPSNYPGDKRLAVQVEDHPIEYGDFEGTIPKGQYGGGTVMVWDFGEWKPRGDADRGLAEGHLKFDLFGEKLKGAWALVRMHNRDARPDKPNWLLIKEKDEFAQPSENPAITEEAPDSAVSKRTIEQIAKANDRTWQSNRSRDQEPAPQQLPKKASINGHRASKTPPATFPSLRSLRKENLPAFIEPQLARQSTEPPNGSGWVHELKLDGYRIQVRISPKSKSGNSDRVTLRTRKGLDWTRRMPNIAHAAELLGVESAILDGETVVLDEKGATHFADLQAAFRDAANVQLTYFAFDLLHLNGKNLRDQSLFERRKLLAQLLATHGDESVIRLSEHFEAEGKVVFTKACALGAEGIVSKLASAPYISGRGNVWLKSKCIQEQEFVIGGFTEPSKGGRGIGAVLLGYYDAGKLLYAGRSGTGFTQQTQQTLRKKLDSLRQSKPPFSELPKGTSRGISWVKPELVAQIAFATWTRDNLLRQAAFKGLREDKPAKEVVREVAVAPQASETFKQSPTGKKPRLSPKRETGATKTRGDHAPMTDPSITHPEKILDKESGLTKRMLADYYRAVADQMLPHLAGRPLSLVRCPEGTGKACFFQKHIGLGLPPGVDSIPVPNPKTGEKEQYVTLSSAAGLIGLAQMGVLEVHPWGSRNDSLEKPDRIIFDLDPDEAIDWKTIATTAKELRSNLQALGLESFLKTTGGKGLHVVVPIRPEHEWPVVKQFAHSVVLGMEKKNPDLYLTKMTKALRKNHIYLDYLRNDRGSTAVAPYSPRARTGAPVALPLSWKELDTKNRPAFRVADFDSWKTRLNRDPWAKMPDTRQRLTAQALRAASK